MRPPLRRLRPGSGPHRGGVRQGIQEKYQGNEDPVFRTRAILIKEQRAELVKHHLWVLWTDYFKPPHFEKYPQLHELFNKATKQAGAAGGKGSMDPAEGQKLLDLDRRDRQDLLGDQGRRLSFSRLPALPGHPRAARQRRVMPRARRSRRTRLRLGSAHARVGESVIDVGALLEKVEAAAPIDAVEAVAAALGEMVEAGGGPPDRGLQRPGRRPAHLVGAVEGARSRGVEQAETLPLTGTVYERVLRTQQVDVADGSRTGPA